MSILDFVNSLLSWKFHDFRLTKNWRITQENTPTLEVNLKINDIIDDGVDDSCVYSAPNTVLVCLTLSSKSNLYQKKAICLENWFSAC